MENSAADLPVTEIEIAYGGEAYEHNEIDAKTLGEALTSLNDLIEHAEKILNGEGAETKVNIRATKEGSFTLLIAVIGSIKTINALGLAIGAGAVSGGVLGVLEWLKGRKISSITIDQHTDKAIIEVDGEQIECSNDVQKLITSPLIRREIDKIVYKPLQTKKPSTFAIKENNRKVVKLEQNEAGSFKATKATFIEKTHVQKREANVTFSNINFLSTTGWKMILPGGDEVSTTMKDEAFLERVNLNQAAFCKDDMFSVELTETVKETNGQMSKPRYSVIKVLRHRAASDRKLV
ncbi:hypothetical protein BV923_22945 [Pectobacterium odoriferum]|nr:hypothetical protein BV923_22945 [Pectobacterium odoriferum]